MKKILYLLSLVIFITFIYTEANERVDYDRYQFNYFLLFCSIGFLAVAIFYNSLLKLVNVIRNRYI